MAYVPPEGDSTQTSHGCTLACGRWLYLHLYANVNPEVNHPRWSQGWERRLPSSLFNPNRIRTQMFNGYGEQVAGLYKGMDLARYY